LPYAPIVTALRGLVRERGVAEVTALLPGGDAGELAALVPELGSPPAGGDPEMAQGRLFGLLLVLLEQLAAKQTLVLVIEDSRNVFDPPNPRRIDPRRIQRPGPHRTSHRSQRSSRPLSVAERAEFQALRWADPLPVPEDTRRSPEAGVVRARYRGAAV
jgi:hypothetical protein